MASPCTIGTYRLLAELGHGGMADVYLAAVEGPAGSGFTKLAVVKTLRRHLAADPEFVSMLMDEARVTARLAHPNIIDLFEVGEDDGQYFLAMEFLEGQPLNRVARRIERAAQAGADIPRDVSYTVLSDMLAGLHHAHELADYDGTPLGIVHRDVTPHNVFVTYEGVVKVVDFGIAKATGRLTNTGHGIVKGKVRYMSPEQATCMEVDRRTDIFGAGVMLWNLATGTKLWGDRVDIAVVNALRAGDYPASPRAIFPDVPIEVDAICRKALAVRREDRYETAAAMRADLDAFLGNGRGAVRTQLASTMKEIFKNERAKLRRVLQASSLTSLPSVELLGARAGAASSQRLLAAPPADGLSSRREGATPAPGDRGKGKRSRRSSGQKASLAAVSGASSSAGRVASGRHGRAASASPPAQGRSFGNAWTFGLAALAILLAGASQSSLFAAHDAELAPRLTATLDPDLTPLVHDVRQKNERADAELAALPGRNLSMALKPSAQPKEPSGLPVGSAAPSSPSVIQGRRGTTIDAIDPWRGKP